MALASWMSVIPTMGYILMVRAICFGGVSSFPLITVVSQEALLDCSISLSVTGLTD